MNWLAPVHGHAGLKTAADPAGAWSDSAADAASLLVLGLSLIGGGRIIRRLRQQAVRRPELEGRSTLSRPPMAGTHVGPRRVAR